MIWNETGKWMTSNLHIGKEQRRGGRGEKRRLEEG